MCGKERDRREERKMVVAGESWWTESVRVREREGEREGERERNGRKIEERIGVASVWNRERERGTGRTGVRERE